MAASAQTQQTAPTPQAQSPQANGAAMREQLQGIVATLAAEAEQRVGKRRHVEERWVRDLEQYHGEYDPQTRERLKKAERSELFVNLTGPKTDAMSARLMDLLFPTDDRNWGILPTPVPELTDAAEQAMEKAKALKEQAEAAQAAQGQDPSAPPMPPQDPMQAQALQQQANDAQAAADQLQTVLDEARRRAELMEREIDDQLKQSRYQAEMRDVVEDACKLGTGVAKGPVVGDKLRARWKKNAETGEFEMSPGDKLSPSMRRVDIWSFFPDMDARTIEESEGVYERHLMNKKAMRRLAAIPGGNFDKDAIRQLLKDGPRLSAPSYLADLRNLTGENQEITNDLFHVWEYTGPLSAEDMRTLAMGTGDMGTAIDLEEADPLTSVQAVIWFCQGEVLKFSIYPLDSGETLYSVFNLKKDESSIFGYGVPHLMRDPQRALNGAWRMMMDNGAISTGPQIVYDPEYVEPENGSWTITPMKFWRRKSGAPKGAPVFEAYHIDGHQAELANIIAIASAHIDAETAMPQIAQGEQGAGVTKTAQGMALLMNSANVVFRRIVKNFDDDMTSPNIRRMYDWNMQFSTKEAIKGDYEVDARGSSVLLVREMQAQNLLTIALQFGAHPVFGVMLKNRDLLRKIFQAHMLPADEVVLSDDEIDEILARAAENAAKEGQAGTEDPAIKQAEIEFRQDELAAKIEMANMDAASRIKVAELNRETTMIKMAEQMNMTLDQLEAKLTDSREERMSKERIFASEAAMTERAGAGGGGYL